MVKALVAAAIGWPVLLGAALVARVHGHGSTWTWLVYLVASRACHQLPWRSFHTAGIQWPVCGRCAGLYLAAPFGALSAATRRGRRLSFDRLRIALALAAIPTLLTVALEWPHLSAVSSVARALAALPLGAALAFVIVRAAAPPPAV